MPAAAGSFALRAGCICELEAVDVEDADSGEHATFGEIADLSGWGRLQTLSTAFANCPRMGQHLMTRHYFEYQESLRRNL